MSHASEVPPPIPPRPPRRPSRESSSLLPSVDQQEEMLPTIPVWPRLSSPADMYIENTDEDRLPPPLPLHRDSVTSLGQISAASHRSYPIIGVQHDPRRHENLIQESSKIYIYRC